MRIARISVYALTMPLHRPYRLSGGRLLFTELDSTFVRIETDTGLVGWGEGCPWGHTYLPAHGAGIRAAAEVLAPALLGLDPRRLEHVNCAMDLALPGHPYAKAPFDIACWDLFGQDTGESVVADTAAQHLAQSIPLEMRIGTWLCQELVRPDPAPGFGTRNENGHARAPQRPGFGVAPDPDCLGEPVAVFRAD